MEVKQDEVMNKDGFVYDIKRAEEIKVFRSFLLD